VCEILCRYTSLLFLCLFCGSVLCAHNEVLPFAVPPPLPSPTFQQHCRSSCLVLPVACSQDSPVCIVGAQTPCAGALFGPKVWFVAVVARCMSSTVYSDTLMCAFVFTRRLTLAYTRRVIYLLLPQIPCTAVVLLWQDRRRGGDAPGMRGPSPIPPPCSTYDVCPRQRTGMPGMDWGLQCSAAVRAVLYRTRNYPVPLHCNPPFCTLPPHYCPRFSMQVPIPGMEELLHELKASGYRMYVLSNIGTRTSPTHVMFGTLCFHCTH
jgi:hypothetical protein